MARIVRMAAGLFAPLHTACANPIGQFVFKSDEPLVAEGFGQRAAQSSLAARLEAREFKRCLSAPWLDSVR